MCSDILFYFHFSNDGWCWTPFDMFIFHLYISSGEMPVELFCPSFNWVITYFLVMSSLYSLGTSSLLDMCFGNIFSVSGSFLSLDQVTFLVRNSFRLKFLRSSYGAGSSADCNPSYLTGFVWQRQKKCLSVDDLLLYV